MILLNVRLLSISLKCILIRFILITGVCFLFNIIKSWNWSIFAQKYDLFAWLEDVIRFLKCFLIFIINEIGNFSLCLEIGILIFSHHLNTYTSHTHSISYTHVKINCRESIHHSNFRIICTFPWERLSQNLLLDKKTKISMLPRIKNHAIMQMIKK